MDTFLIVFIVDKSVETASKVAVTEVITKFLLYYVYEHLTEFMGVQYDKRCGAAIIQGSDLAGEDEKSDVVAPEPVP